MRQRRKPEQIRRVGSGTNPVCPGQNRGLASSCHCRGHRGRR
jgi:hypothetical protein